MANDIVAGLFGLSPEQVRQQQQLELQKSAYQQAQMDPFARAGMMLAQGAGGLVDVAAPAFGLQNREVAAAQARQEALQGLGVTNPASIRNVGEQARQRGDFQLAAQLSQLANQREAEQADIMYKTAQAQKLQAEANRTPVPTAPKIESYEKDGYKVTVQFNPATGGYDEIGRNKIKEPAGGNITPVQKQRVLSNMSTDFTATGTAKQTAGDISSAITDILNSKGLSARTGYSAAISPTLQGKDAITTQQMIDSLMGKVTLLGKAAAAASGAIGPMAVQEWGIIRDSVTKLDPMADNFASQLADIKANAENLAKRMEDSYGREYADSFSFAPQFEPSKIPVFSRKSSRPEQAKEAAALINKYLPKR